MFFKVGVPKSFAIFAGKSLCWNLFLIKLQVWRLAIFMKKWLQHRCFPANPTQVFSCFSIVFFIEHLRWLLLQLDEAVLVPPVLIKGMKRRDLSPRFLCVTPGVWGSPQIYPLYKKWIFQLRFSSVNVAKSARNYGFGHICWRNT